MRQGPKAPLNLGLPSNDQDMSSRKELCGPVRLCAGAQTEEERKPPKFKFAPSDQARQLVLPTAIIVGLEREPVQLNEPFRRRWMEVSILYYHQG